MPSRALEHCSAFTRLQIVESKKVIPGSRARSPSRVRQGYDLTLADSRLKSGSVSIYDIDISAIGLHALHALRTRIAIIP